MEEGLLEEHPHKQKINKTNRSELEQVHRMEKHIELIASLTSGIIILLTWLMTSYISEPLWIALHIIAFIIGGFAQAREGIIDTIKEKELNVELLMIIAAIGSAAIGFWTEGAILIFIFSLAGALETYTLNRSNQEVASLMELQPEEAVLITNGVEKIVPVSDLQVGDTILVRASERIPVDGEITNGITSIDEAAITGESIPVSKEIGQHVFASTVSLNGTITVDVTKPASDTLFQKIIDMVQSAKDEKPPTQLFIEKFEGTYVNIVIVTVIIMMFLPYFLFDWTLTESIYRAMVLLVVASPCALVASIMPATLSAISNGAKKGLLFKGGVHVENASHVKAIAFDKTGTLTKGMPEITDIIIENQDEKDDIIAIVGAIESESTHSLAKAITAYSIQYNHDHFSSIEVEEIKVISGMGLQATVNNEQWVIGKPSLVGENKTSDFKNGIARKIADEGKTVIFVSRYDKVVALFALKDTIRPEAKKTIQSLNGRGIYTIMLTGDNEHTARAIAKEAGLSDYIAECLPDEKVTHIKQLIKDYGNVAMVGDGINDAPALAIADVGIAMGEGTDIALETADVVLMKNDLSKITDAIHLSSKMNRIIKQNVFFSLTVIGMLIISNFFQFIDLPLGVIGHEGSTILVILNGLRLLK